MKKVGLYILAIISIASLYHNGIILGIVCLVILFLVMFFNKPFCPQTNLIQDIADHNYIDKLTNLLNRDRFFKDLPDAKGIILIDLDDFFLINSVYSKEIGDEFLKKLAHKIAHNNCTKNSIYRTGGDEFAIISYQEKDLVGIAECLLETIERFYIKKDNILIQLSATIAISYKQPLIETADLALKYGKKNRLNLVVFSNTLNIFQETQAFLDITMRIKQALKTDNVVPFFQCIKDKDGNITKYESLMRIKEQDKYLVPAIFLDIAKKTKLYPQLTMHMVTKTFKFMRYKNIPFSINISYDDIINHRIYNFLLQEIDQFDKPQNIIIELLETEAFEQFNYVHNFINELKKRGVKIAIDDFGSGYSNFIYLEKLKPDFIKIDGEIVSKLLFSENSAFLVKTIVDFCKKNNIISIAEFVSHREIFLALKEIGVDEYQGYYLCKVEEDI